MRQSPPGVQQTSRVVVGVLIIPLWEGVVKTLERVGSVLKKWSFFGVLPTERLKKTEQTFIEVGTRHFWTDS